MRRSPDAFARDIAAQRERAVATLAENRRALERQSDLFRSADGLSRTRPGAAAPEAAVAATTCWWC